MAPPPKIPPDGSQQRGADKGRLLEGAKREMGGCGPPRRGRGDTTLSCTMAGIHGGGKQNSRTALDRQRRERPIGPPEKQTARHPSADDDPQWMGAGYTEFGDGVEMGAESCPSRPAMLIRRSRILRRGTSLQARGRAGRASGSLALFLISQAGRLRWENERARTHSGREARRGRAGH